MPHGKKLWEKNNQNRRAHKAESMEKARAKQSKRVKEQDCLTLAVNSIRKVSGIGGGHKCG